MTISDWFLPAVIAAALLSLERIFYAVIWHQPRLVHRLHRHPLLQHLAAPTEVVRLFFLLFKGVQFAVFAGWWLYFTNPGDQIIAPPASMVLLAGLCIVFGQMLNLSVFYRLGHHGVFYGCRLGFSIPWQDGFPFNLIRHPQYVGTVLSIWGLFLLLRYPNPDWLIIPLIETVFYVVGAHLER